MNLHNIMDGGPWMWWQAFGANGQSIGTHLWKAEWSAAGMMPHRAAWMVQEEHWHQALRDWAHQARYAMPWTGVRYLDVIWTPPLCGKRSRSRRPRWSALYSRAWNECPDCRLAAFTQGINPLYSGDYLTIAEHDPNRVARLETIQRMGAL